MKELEKLIPKKCGISSMLVKDLVQQMIDEDGVICVEKCGNINVYWCFKNQITMKLSGEIEIIKQRLKDCNAEVLRVQEELASQRSGARCETLNLDGQKGQRALYLDRIDQLDAQLKKARNSYEAIAETRWSEAKISARVKEVTKQSRKLEVITDNIEIITSYLCRTFTIDRNCLRKELNIPEEFAEFADLTSMLQS